MNAQVTNAMSPMQKLIDFGICIGIADSKPVSFVNRVVVKPIDWLVGKEDTKKVSHFLCRHLIARIVALAASVFAAIDFAYHALTSIAKLPIAALRAAGVKKISVDYTFEAIADHLKNASQSAIAAGTASLAGLINPKWLGMYAYPLSERKKAPIFGYHEVSSKLKNPWTISPALLEKQLEHLYKRNYELCTFQEFLDGYTAPQGKKLAVITFDDSHESQFRVKGIDNDGKLMIDESCAIGVFEKLRKRYPDFRCAATFFVNTSEEKLCHTLFADTLEQKKYTAEKLRYLLDHGYEVGAHGHLHRRFDKLSKKELEEDLTNFDAAIDAVKTSAKEQGLYLDDLKIDSFAWPHGMIPSKTKRAVFDDRFKFIGNFGFGGRKVKQHAFVNNPSACRNVPRIYIGPNSGFEQYCP